MDFKFEFGRHQINKIPREKIIEELEKVAKASNYMDFKQTDFDKRASISSYTVYREFGSWEKALYVLAEYLRGKGINLITSRRRRTKYTDRELFDEIERVWVKLGHRPSENEWSRIDYKISYDTYCRHFGGWQKACLKFIEYKSGKVLIEDSSHEVKNNPETRRRHNNKNISIGSNTSFSRTIPLSVRVKVLARDNFKCVFCGKSPAINAGTVLHIDHIVPFSKAGSNMADNLQTLCEECNLGKSDRLMNINTTQSIDLKKGGDGGQIFIISENISGNGKITADGGDGEMGGNAGKIHIESKTNSYSGNISAKGGKSAK